MKTLWRTGLLAFAVVGALVSVPAPRVCVSGVAHQIRSDFSERTSSASTVPGHAFIKAGAVRDKAHSSTRSIVAWASAAKWPAPLRPAGLVSSGNSPVVARILSWSHAARAPPSSLV
jgi:hypothetical protein